MKKILIIFTVLFMICGCTWGKESFGDKYTYTTIYPIEFATEVIYGDYSNINSIYPSGVDVKKYELTDKQIKKYSNGEKFVYNGLANEAPIAKDLLNLNENIEIIDAMKGMSYSYGIEEIWLDPSNYLMIARNIKDSLKDYTENIYTKEEIEDNYTALKEKISEIDVELYNIGKNKNYNYILTSNNVFNFLTKYDITVISLDSSNSNIDKLYSDAKRLIENKSIKYIYVLKGTQLDAGTTKLIQDYGLEKLEINDLSNITDEQRKAGATYLTIMNEVLDLFKKELYK